MLGARELRLAADGGLLAVLAGRAGVDAGGRATGGLAHAVHGGDFNDAGGGLLVGFHVRLSPRLRFALSTFTKRSVEIEQSPISEKNTQR